MQNDSLMYIDKIKSIVKRSKNFNVASLVHSKTNVIVPHGLNPKSNIIHIRPGAVILNNPYMDLYDFYYREDLDANIIGTKKLYNGSVVTHGIVVDPKRVVTENHYNLVAGNPFPFFKEPKLRKYIFGYKYYLRELYHKRKELGYDKGYQNGLKRFINKQDYNPDVICAFKPYGTDSVHQYKHVIHNDLDLDQINESWIRNELTRIHVYEKIIGLDFLYKRYKKRSELIINGVTIRELDLDRRERFNIPEPFEGFNDLLKFMHAIGLVDHIDSNYTDTCFEGKIIGKNVLNNTYKLENPYYFIIEHQYDGIMAESCDNWQEKLPNVDEDIFLLNFVEPNLPLMSIDEGEAKADFLYQIFSRDEKYEGASDIENYFMHIMSKHNKFRTCPLRNSNRIMYGFNISFYNLMGHYREEIKYDHILSSFWKLK